MEAPVVRAEGVGMEANGTPLLEALELSIEAGEKVLLTGDSGSGKSSFLAALLGFQAVQRGALRVFGKEVEDAKVWEVREHTAYLPQEYELKLDSVRELFYFPFAFKQNRSLRPSEEEAQRAIEHFGLKPEMLDRDPDGISGGEKQRLVAASLLKLQKPLYLLDEPSASLDPGWTSKMADAFLEDADRTVIAVAHDMEWRRKVDRIIELPSGKEVGFG